MDNIEIGLEDCFSDEYDRVADYVDRTANSINYYLNNDTDLELARIVFEQILECSNFWVGKTYVGVPKHKKVKEAYQRFWLILDELVRKMSISQDAPLSFLKKCCFDGTLYRFINTDKIEYDGVYVSWTKNPELSPYMREKLGNRIFRIDAVTHSIKGIDLVKLAGIGRPTEEEVVFPTMKDAIVKIEQIS